MSSRKLTAGQLALIILLLGLQGLACLVYLLAIPADPTNALVFGYSASRLAMAAIVGAGVAVLLVGSRGVGRNERVYQWVWARLTADWAFGLALTGSLLGLGLSTNWPFAAPERLATFERAFPLILFLTLACLHVLAVQVLASGEGRRRSLALVGVAGILLISYASITRHYSVTNREYWLSDQEAMLNTLRGLEASNFEATGTRDFMPGFPLLASPFMDTSLDQAALYAQGKAVNIGLSLAFVAILFLVSLRYLKPGLALLFAALAAFTLFIYKAPYFQPELSYYFFSFLAFALLLELFSKPRLLLALAAGLMLAAAHYIKASALPLVALFAVAMLAQAGFVWLVKRQDWRAAAHRLAVLLVMLLAFLLPLASYLLESKATYGSYFYNVNSSYYIWFDSWGEAKGSDSVYHYGLGQPDFGPGEQPSLSNYVASHTTAEILTRLGKGFANQASNWWNTFALVSFPLVLLGGLLVLAIQRRQQVAAWLREQPVVAFFLLAYFAGYTTLFAWYGPIADYADRRFSYGLYLPLVFCTLLGLQALEPKDGKRNWLPAFYGAIVVLLAADLLLHLPYQFTVFQWFGK